MGQYPVRTPLTEAILDLKHGGVDVVKKAYSRRMNNKTVSQSPSKASSLINLCKNLKRTRTDEPPKCISVPLVA
jgi:hypothetical protein